MGGPFLGKLTIDGKVIMEDVLVDVVGSNESRKVFFAKYFYNPYLVGGKHSFKVFMYDFAKKRFLVYNRAFRSLMLKKLEEGTLYISQAFHAEGETIGLDLSDENWFPYNNNE